MAAGREYGWLREWALSGVIVCQLVVDIAAPVLRTRCCGGLFRPRDPGRRQKNIDNGNAIREQAPPAGLPSGRCQNFRYVTIAATAPRGRSARRKNSVSVGPGIRHDTVTPASFNSFRRAKAKLSRKALLPLYAA